MTDKYIQAASLVLKQVAERDGESIRKLIAEVSDQQGFEFTRLEKEVVREIVVSALVDLINLGEKYELSC